MILLKSTLPIRILRHKAESFQVFFFFFFWSTYDFYYYYYKTLLKENYG